MSKSVKNTDSKMLLELNKFIQNGKEQYDYHINHILLVRKYMLLLARKLNIKVDFRILSYIALAHDLFKERSLDNTKTVTWKGHDIPQDTNRYVRTNLDVLEKFELDDYFNTDIQLHPLSAGIFVYKEFGIRNLNILYPIFFHSCPIIEVYKNLNPLTQNIIDITLLADKMSSNYLKIYYRSKVYMDLNLAIFGHSLKEFNYTLGLYLARLISQGKSDEKQSLLATEFYFKRLQEVNPLISKNLSIDKIADSKIWAVNKTYYNLGGK
jgi:HD superfamily phosphohydrolase YqeK